MSRNENPALLHIYCLLIGDLRRIADEHGWNALVHGSMTTDLDILLVPWKPDADNHMAVFDKWFKMLRGKLSKPVAKPHGRINYIFHIEGVAHLDISVFPRHEPRTTD